MISSEGPTSLSTMFVDVDCRHELDDDAPPRGKRKVGVRNDCFCFEKKNDDVLEEEEEAVVIVSWCIEEINNDVLLLVLEECEIEKPCANTAFISVERSNSDILDIIIIY